MPRVLVVDDSAVVRRALAAILSSEEGFETETASDPLIALDKMKKAAPQVIVLDLELPRMDGFTFLSTLMRAPEPVPVVICSGQLGRDATAAMRALELGAVAVVEKPQLGVHDFLYDSAIALVDTVKGAAGARVRRRPMAPPVPPQTRHTADVVLPQRALRQAPETQAIVAVGASTGGTEALRELLLPMPEDAPAILIVQHMPEGFTRAFANRLNQECRIEVKEAVPGDAVLPGRALVAPGNRHMLLCRHGQKYSVDVVDGPLVSRHRPSVDVLFRSVAHAAGANAVGVILTGMGDDGAAGLMEMRQAGASTLAQDEASCVVFGMPQEAIERGAVDDVLPLRGLPGAVLTRAARVRARC